MGKGILLEDNLEEVLKLGLPNLIKRNNKYSPSSNFKSATNYESDVANLVSKCGDQSDSSVRMEAESNEVENYGRNLLVAAEDNVLDDREKVRIYKIGKLGRCEKMNDEMPKRNNPDMEEGELIPSSKAGTVVKELRNCEDNIVTSMPVNVTEKEELKTDFSENKISGNEWGAVSIRSSKKKTPKQLRDFGPINSSTRNRKMELEGKGHENNKLANLCANYALFGSFSWDEFSINKVPPSFFNSLKEGSSL
ncbi:hypothetical protein MA16_Dca012519 [Dendrobium catenatum]|uniref:Uncharacterized protein n=1 Tax=Dendrobium catenatum TaxID=906689 RepID=A0A2I0W528_9ASPA|nr:hypothetical protein MA16_Dca012519 [Dendrobium catenatum]